MSDETWRDEALCAQIDPDLMFPGKGELSHQHRRICASCPVTEQCGEYAIIHDERYGIWGGLSEHQRKIERRRRGLPRMCQYCHAQPIHETGKHTCDDCTRMVVQARTAVA